MTNASLDGTNINKLQCFRYKCIYTNLIFVKLQNQLKNLLLNYLHLTLITVHLHLNKSTEKEYSSLHSQDYLIQEIQYRIQLKMEISESIN